LGVCIALLISFMLPGNLVQISWLGFLYLTLLLLWRLGGVNSSPGLGRWPRLKRVDALYRTLGVGTVISQLLWMYSPTALRSVGVPLLALFSLFIAWSLVRLVHTLRQEQRIDIRLLSGATAGYLLLGLSGGLFLTVLDGIHPGGFHDNITGMPLQMQVLKDPLLARTTWDLDFSRLNYFAFVSLTTVGYGDITPTLPSTRMASLALSVLGPLYITVVLGVLISRLSNIPAVDPTNRSASKFNAMVQSKDDKDDPESLG